MTPRPETSAVTRAVRAGIDCDVAYGAVTPPVVLSSTFSFEASNRRPVSPTKATADAVTKILKRRVYHEISTLEGSLLTIDFHDKKAFGIFDPLTDSKIVCHFDESMKADVVNALGSRVSVEGKVKFSRSGDPLSIEVYSFEVMPGMEELPQFDQGERLDIASGIPSEDYVRRIRDAE